MSSRALRAVASKKKTEEVIDDSGSEEDDGSFVVSSGRKAFNAFAALSAELPEDDNDDNDNDNKEEVDGVVAVAEQVSPSKAASKKKKKKKKKRAAADIAVATAASATQTTKPTSGQAAAYHCALHCEAAPEEEKEEDEVDRSIREVDKMLGVVTCGAASNSANTVPTPILDTRGLLCVDYRHLNADNEMRRIFGSRVVRTERRQAGRRDHRMVRKSGIISPQASWHMLGKNGLTMQLVSRKGNCCYFALEHDSHYQQSQLTFWECVDTFDPDAISSVVRNHPYHIDALLQLADICKMQEDRRVAADLIERAVYALEGSFHTLFNVATGSNRMDYRKMENRGFFLTLFRHLVMVGLRGCYRTSLEFCKLLLSLDPDTDPLGILLILDFYALRSGEYRFLTRLADEWEAHHHLSLLPNMAFSCALAKFHASGASNMEKVQATDTLLLDDADKMLEVALLQFPMVLVPLLDKCGVVMDVVAKHPFFAKASQSCSEPLQRVCTLYIQRTDSVWKEPEVLTWLEKIALVTLERVDAHDPRVKAFRERRQQLYNKTPRNVLRHLILSDLPNVSAYLPPDVAAGSVMSYDPLPPTGSYADYERHERLPSRLAGDAGFLSTFMRSLDPSFDPDAPAPQMGPAGRPDLHALVQLLGGWAGRNGHGQEQDAANNVAAAAAAGNLGEGGENADDEQEQLIPQGFEPGDFLPDDDIEFD